jgi:hypothetical protein
MFAVYRICLFEVFISCCCIVIMCVASFVCPFSWWIRGPVVGEFYGDTAVLKEGSAQYDQLTNFTGVYRLEVRYTADSTRRAVSFPSSVLPGVHPSSESRYVTRCIPYNATAEQLSTILSEMTLIQKQGGVTVRRVGNGGSRFAFGFSYRIEMDAPSSDVFSLGSVDINVYCAGLNGVNTENGGSISACNCAETKVSLFDEIGRPQCPLPQGTFSLIDPMACVYAPILSVQRISSLAQMNTEGSYIVNALGVSASNKANQSNAGRISVSGGVHRLPHQGSVILESINGIGVIAAGEQVALYHR